MEIKNIVKYHVFAMFHVMLQKPPRMSKSALGGPTTSLKRRPGAAWDAPGRLKRLQDSPKNRQERPKGAPRAAQSQHPSGLGGQMKPTWRPRALLRPPRAHFGAPAGRCSAFRGAIFIQLQTFRRACSKPPCVQSLCKHTSSIARRACVTTTCGITSTCGLVRRRTAGQ